MIDLNKSLQLLEQYFQETDEKTLTEMFKKYDNVDFEGENVQTYLSTFESHYAFLDDSSDTLAHNINVECEDKITLIASVQVKTNSQINFDSESNYNFASAA